MPEFDYKCEVHGILTRVVAIALRDVQVCSCGRLMERVLHYERIQIQVPIGFVQGTLSDWPVPTDKETLANWERDGVRAVKSL